MFSFDVGEALEILRSFVAKWLVNTGFVLLPMFIASGIVFVNDDISLNYLWNDGQFFLYSIGLLSASLAYFRLFERSILYILILFSIVGATSFYSLYSREFRGDGFNHENFQTLSIFFLLVGVGLSFICTFIEELYRSTSPLEEEQQDRKRLKQAIIKKTQKSK